MHAERSLHSLILLLVFSFGCSSIAAQHPREVRAITAEKFRKLPAGSGEVVTVEATVCYQDPLWKFVFLTDRGNGIFIDPVPDAYLPGDRLRISGPVGDGHGVPIFRDNVVVSKLGQVALPAPEQVDLSGWDWDHGFSDSRNSGWIELEGRVEQITLIDESTRLWCQGKVRRFAVTIAEAIDLKDAWELFGARIRIRGALGILLDRQNLIHAPILLAQKYSYLEVLESGKGHAFPERHMRVRHARVGANQSFRTSGQVTLASSHKLFLDDGLAAKAVTVGSSFETPANTFVEVLGTSDSQGNWIAHVIKLRNKSLVIWPMQLSIKDLSENQIGRRIQIRADVTSYDSEAFRLSVNADDSPATIVLPLRTGQEVKSIRRSDTANESLDLATAKEVEVFGVLENIESGVPIIQAMNRGDIRVLSRRWVLTPTNFLWLMGALSIVLVGSFGIVVWLRRQVAMRTRSLSDLAAQLRASCDSVDAGVVAVGDDGTLLTVNDRANSLLMASLKPGDPAEIFVNCWNEKVEDPAELYQMASGFRSERSEPVSCDVSLLNGGGLLRVTLTAINRDGRHIGNLWVMHDETQLQTLQAELAQAQKMEAIGTLAGGVAHDFNNLLTAILGNLTVLRISNPDEEERAKYLEEAESACMSAGELVQQLLGMSRKTNMKQKVVDPNELIYNIQALLKHGFDPNIKFHFATELELPPVQVDPNQIDQVLLNLCVNARDAMPNGGKITVATARDELNNRPAVAIQVSDNGEGIPQQVQSKIFEPFFTTKEVGKGTGLGLTTSFNVVRRHGGELRCDSEPGKGATFSIVLPASTAKPVVQPGTLQEPEVLRGDETILIIDDEWVVRTVAVNLLRAGGYETIETNDGASGLEILAKSHAEIDLVLLDVTMPGMSGHEVFRQISLMYPTLPVLMCSGYDLKDQGDVMYDHFVPKPYAAATLFREIRAALDRNLVTELRS